MKISEVKNQLPKLERLRFQLPDGSFVPRHFHVTEVGIIDKRFIDCGGTVRNEKVASFQLWSSIDVHHRLAPKKLLDIIEISERAIGLGDLDIEVEYQGDTIGKYALGFDGQHFRLESKQTDCLAKDNCGIPKPKLVMAELKASAEACCGPGSNCC